MSTQAKDGLKKSPIIFLFFENFHKGKINIKNNHISFSMHCKNNSNKK